MSHKMRRVKAWQRSWKPHYDPGTGLHMRRWEPSRQSLRRRRVQSRRGYGTANGRVWQRASNPRRWHSDHPPLRIDGQAYRRRFVRNRRRST